MNSNISAFQSYSLVISEMLVNIICCLIFDLVISTPLESASRVIGSVEVESIENFPYQTLQFSRFNTSTSLSSGAILSEKFVITCAHCIDQANSVNLFYGSKTISNLDYDRNQLILSDNFIIHPNYSSFMNDLALIRLNMDIEFDGE